MGGGGTKLQVKTILWPDEVLGLVVGPGGGHHGTGATVHGQSLPGAGHPGPVHGGGQHTELRFAGPDQEDYQL